MSDITKAEYLDSIRKGARDAVQCLLGVGKYSNYELCPLQAEFRRDILSAIERGVKKAMKERGAGQ